MPAQTTKADTVYFVEYDTAPDLEVCLKDGDGEPLELLGSTVTISIAFAMPRGTYYTSPRDQIVKRDPVTVLQEADPPDLSLVGFVSWTPGAQGTETALTPPGEFLYTFEVTYPGGGKQTIPANTYKTLIIKTPVGGRSLNV